MIDERVIPKYGSVLNPVGNALQVIVSKIAKSSTGTTAHGKITVRLMHDVSNIKPKS